MADSLFGGDPNTAHFSCSLGLKEYPLRSDARREAYRAMREAFGREQYFRFRVNNAKQRAQARAQCETLAAAIKSQLGITVEVSEGFFL